jgi:hypothetical protein
VCIPKIAIRAPAVVFGALLVVVSLTGSSAHSKVRPPQELATSLNANKSLTLLPAKPGTARQREVTVRVDGLRLVNYYPPSDPWAKMWTSWNPRVLRRDFAMIHALGGNAVRIIVFPNIFGWPIPSHRMTDRFAETLAIAESQGLSVQVTLFDSWDAYGEVAQSRTWLRSFLGPYADDPEIQLVELKNEVDPWNPAEVGWVRALLPTLRSVLPRTPSTVSVSGVAGPSGFVWLRDQLHGAPLDVADMHFYGDELSAYSWMLAAKQAAGPLPLFVGEIGHPAVSGRAGFEAAALAQAHWFSVVFAAARAAGVPPPAPWTLNDFKPGSIPPPVSSPDEYHFGLYTWTGPPRLSALVVNRAFRGLSTATSNLAFGLGARNGLPMVWSTFLSTQGLLAYDRNVGHRQPGSVRLSNTRLSSMGAPLFYLVPTTPVISGQFWTVSVWAKGTGVNGTAQLSLAWFNSDVSYMGDSNSSPLPQGNSGWTRLLVTARVPPEARSLLICLKSYDNAGTVWFDDVHIAVKRIGG